MAVIPINIHAILGIGLFVSFDESPELLSGG